MANDDIPIPAKKPPPFMIVSRGNNHDPRPLICGICWLNPRCLSLMDLPSAAQAFTASDAFLVVLDASISGELTQGAS